MTLAAAPSLPAETQTDWDDPFGDDFYEEGGGGGSGTEGSVDPLERAMLAAGSEGPPRKNVLTDHFVEGAELAQAKKFAAARVIPVVPWEQDVNSKPIFAVSDGTGEVSRSLAEAAFAQFGCSEQRDVRVLPRVRGTSDVRKAVAQAAESARPGAMAIEKAGAFCVFTLANKDLGASLEEECRRRGVPCFNALEPVLSAMEKCLDQKRCLAFTTGGGPPCSPSGKAEEGFSKVFAVSDGSGANAYRIINAALKQLPASGVDEVTVCPEVRTLVEINNIVHEALALKGLIIFTLASPGLARFMRQQCERSKVGYADVYQPMLMGLEKYLNYPCVGVPGGYSDLEAAAQGEQPPLDAARRWQKRAVS